MLSFLKMLSRKLETNVPTVHQIVGEKPNTKEIDSDNSKKEESDGDSKRDS